jgi:thiosulfate dehydrogenase [quinone] large subunit
MFVEWLRTNTIASVLLLLGRLYLGWKWLTAGWHKVSEGFQAEKFLQHAVAQPVTSSNEVVYPTYHAFLENIALPHVGIINVIVPWGELLVGLGLLLGCLTTAAGFFGLVMNFAFLFAGTVSTNPWMILIGIFLLVGGRNTGNFGLDRFLMPLFERRFRSSRLQANPNVDART